MKNLKSLFLALAIVAVPLTFTSCGEENGYETIPNIALVGEITQEGNFYRATVRVTCAPEGRLRSVEAWAVHNNGESTTSINIPSNAITETSHQDWQVIIANIPMVVAGNQVEALRV